MARPKVGMCTRQVTARFWDNEDLAELEHSSNQPKLRLTMIGLWAASDAAGRFEWRPRMLAPKIFPFFPEDQATVEASMELFVAHGYLIKYEADGKWYGAWPHWGEHNEFRERKSVYPAPDGALDPRNPPHSPEYPPEREGERELEAESEVEVERESGSGGAGLASASQISILAEEAANYLFKKLELTVVKPFVLKETIQGLTQFISGSDWKPVQVYIDFAFQDQFWTKEITDPSRFIELIQKDGKRSLRSQAKAWHRAKKIQKGPAAPAPGQAARPGEHSFAAGVPSELDKFRKES